MATSSNGARIHPAWWTLGLIIVSIAVLLLCMALFAGSFRRYVPVLLTSDRSGLIMESGAKVKFRGVQVGQVAGIDGGSAGPVRLKMEIFPSQVRYIPANVEAEIRATSVFGAKYVELLAPADPSSKRLTAGTVLQSRNVTTEVNTVFQNLVDVLNQVDPPKLNATLTALSQGLNGQGERLGEATTATNEVLAEVNPRMGTVDENWRALQAVSDTYSAAAPDIISTLSSLSTTSATVTTHATQLDALLLNMAGFARAGVELLGPSIDNLVQGINIIEPTTNLLLKYNPEYTCLLVGAKYYLDNGGFPSFGGNGRTMVIDSGVLFGSDPYRYPDNLPIVAAKGGPGGKPSCGSLPHADQNFPVRQLITNTGWGTGLDIRPNPGIGFPGYANYLPVTRAVPEPPSIRYHGGPAPGPIPYPGAPPYGAPLYGPDGAPLYPPPPWAPPPPPR